MYGHLCRSVTLHISGSNPHNFTLFTLQCEYLTGLQVLRLHIQPNEESSSVPTCIKTLDATALNFAGRMAWKSLFLALPGVSELQLYGFTWTDAAEAFKASGPKPGITKLSLDIAASAARPTLHTAHTFNRIFPGLISISLPTHWCPTPAWIRRAFASRRLQSIEVREYGYRCYYSTPDFCKESCTWTSSMEALVELSAASLTSLTISCSFSPTLSFKQSAFPSLTTLTLMEMQGPDDPEAFNTLMEFFLHSPLQQLHIGLTQCPESFCSWFHPTSERWPALRTLSLHGIRTQVGPGDDPWDEYAEERDEWDRLSEGDDCWSSHTRIMLEDHCSKRGIEFDFEWHWFEGYG